MWARLNRKVHPAFGVSSPDWVASAVEKAITKNKVESVVNAARATGYYNVGHRSRAGQAHVLTVEGKRLYGRHGSTAGSG